jgi:nucleoid DNA-binding protein
MAKSKVEAPKAMTKSEILAGIAETTGLAKKDVSAVLDAMNAQIAKACSKKGPGAYAIPGLCKIVVVNKPAQPAKKNVPNPFKPGELMDVAAKPAKRVIKVRPLKALKDMV